MNKTIGFMLLCLIFFLLVGCVEKEVVDEETPKEEAIPETSDPEKDEDSTSPPADSSQNKVNEHMDEPVPAQNDVQDSAENEVNEPDKDGQMPAADPQATPDPIEPIPAFSNEQEVTMLIEEYLYNFPVAINNGAFIYIMHLIDPESTFYDEQVNFVLDAYDRNIYETLIQFKIENISPTGKDTFEVNVQETFRIHYGIEGKEVVKSFENTYTVKKSESVYLISDLKVSEKGNK